MQHVTLYFWRVRDAQGRWVTTRHRATEAQIRLSHPEAECLGGESLTIELPETPEAMALRLQQEHLHYPAITSQSGAFAHARALHRRLASQSDAVSGQKRSIHRIK